MSRQRCGTCQYYEHKSAFDETFKGGWGECTWNQYRNLNAPWFITQQGPENETGPYEGGSCKVYKAKKG